MKKTFCFASLALVAFVAVASAFPSTSPAEAGPAILVQDQKQNPRAQDLTQVPMECEGAATRLDFAVIETEKIEGGYLIIIARLGDGETSTRLNATRLTGIKEYILRRGSDLKYVLAQGARVKGLGRVEVYVGGKLTEIMPFKKNAPSYCVGYPQ